MSDRVELVVRVVGDGVGRGAQEGSVPTLDDSELAAMAGSLRAGLLTLDVEDVRPAAAGPAPVGAKAAEMVVAGALLVSMAPPLIGGVVDVVASWLRRQVVDVEVEIAGHRLKGPVTSQQRDALVAAFLDRTEPEQIPIEPADS
jgi:hypothetical protein